MAVGDVIREILIKIGVLGGAEASAEMDRQAASIEKVGAAGTATAAQSEAASVAQGNALKDVEGALTRAAAQSANFAEASKIGGKVAADEFLFLKNSVGALDDAVKKAQAAGAIVPPATLKSLDDMKAGLTAATAAVAPHVAAVGGAGKAHADTRLQVDLAREGIGQWGRAIGTATESTNPLISALGRFLLPLAAAAGGLVLFNKAAQELSARGVDITSIGDRMSGTWDAIARALGGTSAATAAAASSMSAAEGKMQELDATQRSYGTGLDLLAGLSLDAGKAIKVFEGDLSDTNVTITGFEAQAHDGAAAIGVLNQAFNTIATLSPQRAAGYRAEFAALVTAAQSGSHESIAALQAFQAGVTKAAAEIDAKLTAIALAEGKSAAGAKEWAKDAGQISASATNAAAGLDTLRKAGETEYESFNKLKGPIEAVLAFYTRYPSALSALDAPQKALVQGLIAEAQSHSGVIVEEEKHAAKISDLRGKYADIRGAIDEAGAAYGRRKGEIAAYLPEIDREIAALEKERAANRGLDPEQQRILDNYKKLRGELTATTAEEDKANKTRLDGLKTQHDLSKSYEDLTKAREKDKESIEKHRVDFIAGMDAELKKATESGNAQVNALIKQHDAMEIDEHEYAKSVNDLFANMAIARRAIIEAQDKENAEAAAKELEHQQTYEQKAGEIAAKTLLTFGELKEAQASYDVHLADSLAKARGEWDKTSDKITDHAGKYKDVEIVWGSLEGKIVSGSGNIGVALDGLLGKITNVKKALEDVDKVSSAVFGGTGGGAPEQFGPPTPAPEPTGSAPGSEFTT